MGEDEPIVWHAVEYLPMWSDAVPSPFRLQMAVLQLPKVSKRRLRSDAAGLGRDGLPVSFYWLGGLAVLSPAAWCFCSSCFRYCLCRGLYTGVGISKTLVRICWYTLFMKIPGDQQESQRGANQTNLEHVKQFWMHIVDAGWELASRLKNHLG